MTLPLVVAALAVVLYLVLVRRTFISPDDAHRLVRGGAALVDVRTPAEFAARHLEGALNIPLADLPARADAVGPKDRPVVLYCASGMRSARAAAALRAAGFSAVHNLGSIDRW